MDTVIRAAAIYVIIWALIRLSGRRTLAQMTTFDLILLLMIGSSFSRALTGEDYSVTTPVIVIFTFMVINVGLSLLQRELPSLTRIINGVPMIVVENGRPLEGRLRRARLTTDRVLEAARVTHGLERLDQIKFAVLEASGEISIIPRREDFHVAPAAGA